MKIITSCEPLSCCFRQNHDYIQCICMVCVHCVYVHVSLEHLKKLSKLIHYNFISKLLIHTLCFKCFWACFTFEWSFACVYLKQYGFLVKISFLSAIKTFLLTRTCTSSNDGELNAFLQYSQLYSLSNFFFSVFKRFLALVLLTVSLTLVVSTEFSFCTADCSLNRLKKN